MILAEMDFLGWFGQGIVWFGAGKLRGKGKGEYGRTLCAYPIHVAEVQPSIFRFMHICIARYSCFFLDRC